MNYDASNFRALGIGERIEERDTIKWPGPDSGPDRGFDRVEPAGSRVGLLVEADDPFQVLRPLPVAERTPEPVTEFDPGLAAYAVGPVAIPSDSAARKALPIATGVLDYFPDALLAVATCSRAGNDQHSPGKPMFWDRSKSTDEADSLIRHFLQRGTVDTDGVRHSAKVAWRALALLQKEIEASTGRASK